MKISLSWLQDYVPVKTDVERLAHLLTMAGLEVEAIEERFAYLDQVLVARIQEISPHPNADKLKLCTVDTGQGSCRVVCGAPNAAEGMLSPLATVGCELPNGTVVQIGTIRGQASEGMLCSAAELALGADASGLMALEGDLPPGTPLNQALKLTDAVLEIGLTPNRPDCLSVIGIAREVAALDSASIRRPEIRLPEPHGRIEQMTSVTIESPDHCPRYAARVVENISVGPSPFWLQDRLRSVGLRPINNIVDVTNFVMMETGQPLHAFDFDRLAENRIVVRTAGAGERFTTLDGKERLLEADMLMICDGQKPVAVGGVMGGLNSEIDPGTTRVLIESAYFNPISIRKTAKRLGINSDASHRFERGVDPQGTRYALDRAAQMMVDIGNGQLVEGCIDVTYNLPQAPTLDLSVSATNRLLGTAVERDEIARLLREIEFETAIKSDDLLTVATPSFRVDVSRPEDLMEEVARRMGYDNIPVTFPTLPAAIQPPPKLLTQRQRMRDLLAGMGFTETINYSFVHADSCRRLRLPEADPRCRQLAILNPLSEDQAVMRTSLIPGMLETMRRNLSYQSRNLKLYETGKIFISEGNDRQPVEKEMLAALWSGDRIDQQWHTKPVPCDFFDIKGAVEGVLEGLHVAPVRFTRLEPEQCTYLRYGVAAKIMAAGNEVGLVGQVHPKVCCVYELKQDAFIFELDLARLLPHIPETIQFTALPKYPPTARDTTLILDEAIEAAEMLSLVDQMDESLVEEVRLFDVFQGAPITAGRKSVSLRIVYRSGEKTLEDEEVNRLHKRITDRLVDHFKAGLPT